MEAIYTLRKDIVQNEDNIDVVRYGVNAHRLTGELAESVPSVFCNKLKAMGFIELCNTSGLALVHFKEVVSDESD